MRWIFVSIVSAAVVAAWASPTLAVDAGALGDTTPDGVAPMTGENLVSCTSNENVNCGIEAGERRFLVRCNDATSGSISWTASGLAFGPYPGEFDESGHIAFSNGTITDVRVAFHIDAVDADVVGHKFIAGPIAAEVVCGYPNVLPTRFFSRVIANADVRYEAIIKPAVGGSYADEGVARIVLATVTEESPTGVHGAESTTGQVDEFFISDLLIAPPLAPTAKEQCKDAGFLLFGVFKNQGDCVAFVETNAQNEPGRNRP